MNQLYRIIQSLMFAGVCFVLLLAGCGKQPESKEDQKVVSKEIVMAKKEAPADASAKLTTTPAAQEGQTPESKGTGVTEKEEIPPQEPVQKSGETAPTAQEPVPSVMDPDKAAQEAQMAADAYMQGDVPSAVKPQVENGEKPVSDPLIKPLPGEAVQPAPTLGEEANKMAYVYNPVGKIDPFASIFKERPENAPEVHKEERKRRVPMTPLEQISLDQLKLVAVMLAPSGDRALVEEASGKGYVITQGTFIGRNAGQVIDILMDRIIIEEEVEDLLGKLVVKKTEMMLQKTPGE
jgi:type IV pilus assembly protein PilP